jgi:hypothetical protein
MDDEQAPGEADARFPLSRERDERRSLGYGGWYLPVYVKAR